ncbi:integrator complex assembly factor Brat1 [Megachile rotundata]|uniref:integrator complex assembly factor Brat1 n=1 Tax=Megachile rotundata TaxID=143995 RepID=UPI000258F887|nr:PREDICTED: uncharacterized protein LOC100881696 [Megachile rotundata]XP_012152485.1 PREDICTED: uncharacterized protein LOC100881696 [Megachile rotundata]
MTSLKTDERLSEVLELFLLPNYDIVSTTYLDLMLSHISKNIKERNTNDYEHCELFWKWISKALNVWSVEFLPSQPIMIFTLKLVGIISRNELHFHYWQNQDLYNRLCSTFKLRGDDIPVSVKMAYTTMLSNLIEHRSGRQWIIKFGIWKDIVKYAHWNHTLYVTRASQKFVWLLLLYEQQNINFCKEVILEVASPLMTNTFETQVYHVLNDNCLEQNKLLCTTLDLLSNIIENTFFVNIDNTIPELCEEVIDLELRVKALFETCISTRLLSYIEKLLLQCLFIPLRRAIKEGKEAVDCDTSQKFCCDLTYILLMLLSKTYLTEVIRIHKLLMIYWKKLQSLRAIALPHEHKFEHQIISVMVLPLAICIRLKYRDTDIFNMFVTKIFNITSTTVHRLAYKVRDTIIKNDLPAVQIAKTSIDMVLEIIDIIDRDVAVIAFQIFSHVLKNYVPDIDTDENADNAGINNLTNVDNGPKKYVFKCPLEGDPIVDHPTLLASLLNALAIMTEKFKLKWQECVETVCLLSIAQEILNHPGALATICVKALRVCKLAIQNFMPSNLVLLIETDSHMNEIGPTLFKRLHDVNWEVRDSVLEVLNTIAIISEDKYPAFQEFLLANQFVQVAIEIAKSDCESYVRASALIFISSTVRINKIWDEKLSRYNLPDIAMKLLREESEAIVRKEAVILMKELYVHRKWQKDVIDLMSRAMSTAAVLDLHWEVKINALDFWIESIKSHLSDQGVLDGQFPNVTFSKEHRKIVALNETEIKRRLNKALDELARQNCLGVLLVTLEDESDFEVCKKSALIINKLKKFLLKYKLNEPLPELTLPENSAVLDTCYVKYELSEDARNPNANQTLSNSSNVIEEIVDANDANLLASICKNSMKMNEEMEKTEGKTLKSVSRVTRQIFLKKIFNSDIDAYVADRSRWLSTYTTSFESIMEDILTIHKKGDVNSMDCY